MPVEVNVYGAAQTQTSESEESQSRQVVLEMGTVEIVIIGDANVRSDNPNVRVRRA